MNQVRLGLTWVGLAVLVALVVAAISSGRSQLDSLQGVWRGRLVHPDASQEVGGVGASWDLALRVPGLFAHQGLPADAHVVVTRTIVLPENGPAYALWLERPQYAAIVSFDGRELARAGDPRDPAGARTDATMFVSLPREPGAHVLELELRGDHAEGGITGRVLLGPHDDVFAVATGRENHRLGLTLILAVMGILQLAVATRRPKQPTYLLFGLFATTFALWAFHHTDASAAFLELASRIRVRRVATGLFPALGLAFMASFLYGRPRRVEYGALLVGGITSVVAVVLPASSLYRLETAQDVLLVVVLVWAAGLCVHGAVTGIRWAAVLLLAIFPPLLLSSVSDVLVSHGVISASESVFPSATLFVVGLGVALAVRHAEEAARHDRLLVGNPDALVSIDRTGRVQTMNEAAVALLGRAVVGQPLAERIVAQDLPLLQVHRTCQVPRAELRLARYPDRVFESVATSLDEATVLLVLRDVTRRRELDGVVLQAARLETVGLLVGGIAHDFNNMLGTLLAQVGFLQLVSKEEEVTNRLERMERTIGRASLLVRRMLTVARGTSPELEPVDFAAICRGACDLVEPTLPRCVRLVLDLPDDLPPVLGAGTDLEQVIVNLVVNARDAVEEGGHIAVRVRVARAADGLRTVVLVVEDDGPGVAESRKAEVFLPFVSSKSPRRGSGLGLAVSAQIIRDHMGRLWVEDRPGGGARFLAALREATVAPEEDTGLPVDRRVLLAEDETELLESYASALREAGYDVRSYATGDDAAQALRQHPPAILVTDVVMPGCSGIDLAETCNALYPGVPVLLVSGFIPHEGTTRVGDGRWYRLDKPVRPSRLVGEVGRIRRRAERGGEPWESHSRVQRRQGSLHDITGGDLRLDATPRIERLGAASK